MGKIVLSVRKSQNHRPPFPDDVKTKQFQHFTTKPLPTPSSTVWPSRIFWSTKQTKKIRNCLILLLLHFWHTFCYKNEDN